jgi:hypothetical protein
MSGQAGGERKWSGHATDGKAPVRFAMGMILRVKISML